jgi:hypothetical protein
LLDHRRKFLDSSFRRTPADQLAEAAALDMKVVRAKPGIFRDRREAGRLHHDLELFKVRDFAPDFAQLLRQRFD